MTKKADYMRQSGSSLPALQDAEEITSLRIWHCKFRDIKSITRCVNLEELVIGSYPSDTLDILESFPHLKQLEIVHLPKIKSLRSLSVLTAIQSISLATSPSWDAARKCTVVESLEPLAGLRTLMHLELFGVRPPDSKLVSLYGCNWIKSARFSQYSEEETQAFYNATGAINDYNPKAFFP